MLFSASVSGSSERKQDIFNHLKANDPSFCSIFSAINRGRTCWQVNDWGGRGGRGWKLATCVTIGWVLVNIKCGDKKRSFLPASYRRLSGQSPACFAKHLMSSEFALAKRITGYYFSPPFVSLLILRFPSPLLFPLWFSLSLTRQRGWGLPFSCLSIILPPSAPPVQLNWRWGDASVVPAGSARNNGGRYSWPALGSAQIELEIFHLLFSITKGVQAFLDKEPPF